MKRLLVTLIAVVGLTACRTVDRAIEEPLPSTASTPMVSPPPTARVSPSGMPPRQPRNLKVWHYDAKVIPLRLTGSELVPPPDPKVLGWWGRPAGAKHGTTLLTGHTVSTGGGTFDDLESIPLGKVATVAGHRYTVASVEVISKQALARRAPRLFSQTGKHRVVLVTCEDYNPDTGEYGSNVVVTLIPA